MEDLLANLGEPSALGEAFAAEAVEDSSVVAAAEVLLGAAADTSGGAAADTALAGLAAALGAHAARAHSLAKTLAARAERSARASIGGDGGDEDWRALLAPLSAFESSLLDVHRDVLDVIGSLAVRAAPPPTRPLAASMPTSRHTLTLMPSAAPTPAKRPINLELQGETPPPQDASALYDETPPPLPDGPSALLAVSQTPSPLPARTLEETPPPQTPPPSMGVAAIADQSGACHGDENDVEMRRVELEAETHGGAWGAEESAAARCIRGWSGGSGSTASCSRRCSATGVACGARRRRGDGDRAQLLQLVSDMLQKKRSTLMQEECNNELFQAKLRELDEDIRRVESELAAGVDGDAFVAASYAPLDGAIRDISETHVSQNPRDNPVDVASPPVGPPAALPSLGAELLLASLSGDVLIGSARSSFGSPPDCGAGFGASAASVEAVAEAINAPQSLVALKAPCAAVPLAVPPRSPASLSRMSWVSTPRLEDTPPTGGGGPLAFYIDISPAPATPGEFADIAAPELAPPLPQAASHAAARPDAHAASHAAAHAASHAAAHAASHADSHAALLLAASPHVACPQSASPLGPPSPARESPGSEWPALADIAGPLPGPPPPSKKVAAARRPGPTASPPSAVAASVALTADRLRSPPPRCGAHRVRAFTTPGRRQVPTSFGSSAAFFRETPSPRAGMPYRDRGSPVRVGRLHVARHLFASPSPPRYAQRAEGDVFAASPAGRAWAATPPALSPAPAFVPPALPHTPPPPAKRVSAAGAVGCASLLAGQAAQGTSTAFTRSTSAPLLGGLVVANCGAYQGSAALGGVPTGYLWAVGHAAHLVSSAGQGDTPRNHTNWRRSLQMAQRQHCGQAPTPSPEPSEPPSRGSPQSQVPRRERRASGGARVPDAPWR